MADLELDPEDELSIDDRGDDTQLRFHYQAQRVAVLAVSLILPEPAYARIFCELHEDALLKHFDRTYSAYQVKTKERSQPKFRATEKTMLKAIRNFARLQRRFGSRMRRFVIASNHPISSDKDKNDLRFLMQQVKSSAVTDGALGQFMTIFDAKYRGYKQSEIIEVLRKLEIRDEEPDFSSALTAVVESLRRLPELRGADDQVLLVCAHALIAKIEASSRKRVVEIGDEEVEEEYTKSAVNGKLLTPSIVRNTLQGALRIPLGTMYRSIAVESVPADLIPVIKSAFAASGPTLLSTKRNLADGTRFERPEFATLLAAKNEGKPMLIVGEPGSGKSALLADLFEALGKEGKHVVAIKCEDVPKGVHDQLSLAEYLSLPYGAAQCIKTIAETEPVVLLVDQLDAIGALWDTQTARMQAVLSLVHMVKLLPNTRVIISCREFDAKYDVRISNFDAVEIRLELPSSEQITQVLSANGLDCTKWPDDFVALLCNPQHLDIFVDLLRDSADQVETVRTYMDLLGLLWTRRVSSEDSKVLSNLCESINDRKQLFVPFAGFDRVKNAIERLAGAGILKFTNNKNNIGFAHQTLFEYCLARTFVHGETSFSSYVIEQQDSLHCRPLIWSCLHYLRNCDSATYERELIELLARDELRNHIKSLLVQFMAQVRNPTGVEKAQVLPRIRSGYFSELDLLQFCKNAEWLDILLPTYLPILMTDSKTHDLATRILAAGCKLREQTVVSLLQRHWLSVPDQDKYSIIVLREVKKWNLDLCEALGVIISRNNFNRSFIEYLISDISKSVPSLAPLVVARWLKQQYFYACSKPKGDFTPPADLSEVKRYLWIYNAMQDDPQLKEVVAIIDGRQRYALPEVANRAPVAFMEAVWPIFREMLELLSKQQDDIRRIYLSDLAHWTGQKRTKLLEEKYSLVAIFADIMPLFAAAEPEQFERFVAENANSELLHIHRLLCWGMAAIAHDRPDFALTYLCGDERRLMVGSIYDPHSETIALINEISSKISIDSLKQLENVIRAWQLYINAGVLNSVDGRQTWQREHRLRLLSAIPEAVRDQDLANFILAESTALPGFDKEQMSEPEVCWAESPMSTEQMKASAVEDIQAMFEELDDEQAAHPSNFRLGGVVEASRELEKLVETDLEKALRVAATFLPNRDETAVSYLVTGVGRSKSTSLSELETIVREFANRGFNSAKFYSAVACAVDCKLGKPGVTLSNDIVALLEGAIRALSVEPVAVLARSDEDREESVLWSNSHFQAVSMEGMRPMIAALTQHYFACSPPSTEKWLELLSFAVIHRSDQSTWQSLALTDLWRLNQVDYDSARHFIKILFEQQPEVLSSRSGVFLLYSVMNILEPAYFSGIVDSLKRSDWNLAEQAAGELVTVEYFVRKSAWSRQVVDNALKGGLNEKLVAGVAYTIGRAWLTNSHRKEAVEFLERLLSLGSERVTRALASKMKLSDRIVPDEETFRLIDLLCSRPKLLRLGFASIIEAVPELILWDAERSYNLLKAFTDEVGLDFFNHSTQLPYFAKCVVEATLTLQKIPGFETQALELFEQQMNLGMHEAHEIIAEIDRLPKLSISVP